MFISRSLSPFVSISEQVPFKMFIGVTADVASWNGDGTPFSLLLYDKPRTDVYLCVCGVYICVCVFL